MKKAEVQAHFGRKNAPHESRQIFNLSENSPKYRKLKISKRTLCLFPFLSGAFCLLPHLRRAKRQNLRTCFSVIQLSNISKSKRAATFPSSSRTFRVTAPKTIFEFNNSLNFKFRERKRAAPAVLNLSAQAV